MKTEMSENFDSDTYGFAEDNTQVTNATDPVPVHLRNRKRKRSEFSFGHDTRQERSKRLRQNGSQDTLIRRF